ncbi:hypothetical protein MAPG_08401 [Magnaporthiopsis poae ATCC 64411]|uniref:Uncharacterized protein n=1 Tax=Magnaporthiopsis poae (strain ATCC 64411 / 73-15) TaxID=644358 RepID=A0A0C4E797_MAGP6|nr:hypothetical protein MAPG_08401 [Magnaporthiopsis poae ATCC 64411]
MGSWIGWCPVGATCGILNGYAACINQNGKTVAAETPSTAVTTVPTSKSSGTPEPTRNSGGGGLSQGATIGIAVSVTCSVLGLIIGVWIKYHFSKKAVHNGQVP